MQSQSGIEKFWTLTVSH